MAKPKRVPLTPTEVASIGAIYGQELVSMTIVELGIEPEMMRPVARAMRPRGHKWTLAEWTELAMELRRIYSPAARFLAAFEAEAKAQTPPIPNEPKPTGERRRSRQQQIDLPLA